MKIRLVDDVTDSNPLPSVPERTPYTACPLCGATGWSRVTVPGVEPEEQDEAPRWRSCEGCGHVHTDGHLDAAIAQQLSLRAEQSRLPGEGDVEGERRGAGRVVHRVSELRGSIGGAWLDVGAADGALMTTAAEYGYDAAGLDPSRAVVERLLAHGYEAGQAEITDLEGEAAFDVVSFDGSLARQPFPDAALAAAARLLRPGGVLFVSLPNLDSFSWRVLDERGANPHWFDPTCFHLFTREGLYGLLRRHGLEPVDYSIGSRGPAGMEVCAVRCEELG